MIIDSHCHLTFEDYEDELDTVIQNAVQKGKERRRSERKNG